MVSSKYLINHRCTLSVSFRKTYLQRAVSHNLSVACSHPSTKLFYPTYVFEAFRCEGEWTLWNGEEIWCFRRGIRCSLHVHIFKKPSQDPKANQTICDHKAIILCKNCHTWTRLLVNTFSLENASTPTSCDSSIYIRNSIPRILITVYHIFQSRK